MSQGRRVGIDVGSVRIGIAASDFNGILASPFATLDRKSDLEETIESLLAAIEELDAVELVVGLPINLQGRETRSTEDAIAFAKALSAAARVPVFMVDERLSTVAAASALRSSGKNSKQARGVIDQIAATVILETALAARKSGDSTVVREIGDFYV